MAIKLHSLIDKLYEIILRNNFPTLIQMVNIKEGNFNFPMFSISISQSSVQAIGKFEQIGKITIYIISQG